MTRSTARMVAAAVCTVVAVHSANSCNAWADATEVRARSAIAALISASSLAIDQESSCHGALPGIAKPTLADVLASRLVDLDRGKNGVVAHCDNDTPTACRVTIQHADGEDVSSAEFRFRLTAGQLAPGSLVCVLTP